MYIIFVYKNVLTTHYNMCTHIFQHTFHLSYKEIKKYYSFFPHLFKWDLI